MGRPSKAGNKRAYGWNGRYGLEKESESDVEVAPLSKKFFDDVWGTSKSLVSLQSHPDFKKWLAAEGISAEDHRLVELRLQLYRELRRVDPPGFWALVTKPSEANSLPCGWLLAILEYLLNTVLSSALLLTSFLASTEAARVAAGVLLLCNAACWLQGTSLFGSLVSLWFTDMQWGHRLDGWRCLLCNSLEVLYCTATLGLGGLVSISRRVFSAESQSVAERIFETSLVRETQQETPLPEFVEAEPTAAPKASSPASPRTLRRRGR